MKLFATTLVFVTLFAFHGFGQSSVGQEDHYRIAKMEMDIMKGFGAYRNAIFETDESDSFIIDFQEIPFNLKAIKLLDENAHVIFVDDVRNLPVDALYELDLSKFPGTNYTLQLDTYNSSFFMDISK